MTSESFKDIVLNIIKTSTDFDMNMMTNSSFNNKQLISKFKHDIEILNSLNMQSEECNRIKKLINNLYIITEELSNRIDHRTLSFDKHTLIFLFNSKDVDSYDLLSKWTKYIPYLKNNFNLIKIDIAGGTKDDKKYDDFIKTLDITTFPSIVAIKTDLEITKFIGKDMVLNFFNELEK